MLRTPRPVRSASASWVEPAAIRYCRSRALNAIGSSTSGIVTRLPRPVRRTLAGFLGLAAVIVVLFGLMALVALQPREGLAWVHIPQLGPDLGLDAGLHTKPLKQTVVADAMRDRAIEGQGSLSVTAVMVAPPKGDPTRLRAFLGPCKGIWKT